MGVDFFFKLNFLPPYSLRSQGDKIIKATSCCKKNVVEKLSLTKKKLFLALPVTEIPFPTFTICPQGQHYTVFLASIFNLFFKYLKAKNITQKLTPYKAAKLYAKDAAKLVRYLDLDTQVGSV